MGKLKQIEKIIYFFIPFYPERTTGGNKYHSIIYEILAKRYANVKVFGNEPDINKIENSKIRKIIFGIKYAFKIPKNSTIVLTNTAFLHFLIPLLTISLFKKHNYVMVIHHLLRDQKSKYLVMLFENLFIRLVKNKITVSESTKSCLFKYKLINEKIPVINPGLEYVPDNACTNKIINETINFLFIGNIEVRKSIITIIKALDILESIKFFLRIIGRVIEAEYYDELIDSINRRNLVDKIQIINRVTPDELKEYYRKSDIFLFPSKWEGYGMVITEAMAFGLPVVASDIPTSRELIMHMENGLLFEVDNYVNLAELITELVKNKNLYSSISKNSIKTANRLKNWKQVSTEIYNLIK